METPSGTQASESDTPACGGDAGAWPSITPKRVSRLNPASAWIRKEVPRLRIVSDKTLAASKERQLAAPIGDSNRRESRRREVPTVTCSRAFTKCGVCGAGFIMPGKHRFGCFGARDQGRCDTKASEALRGLIDAIVLTPSQGELQIELRESGRPCCQPPQMRRGRPKQATSRCKVKWLRGLATR